VLRRAGWLGRRARQLAICWRSRAARDERPERTMMERKYLFTFRNRRSSNPETASDIRVYSVEGGFLFDYTLGNGTQLQQVARSSTGDPHKAFASFLFGFPGVSLEDYDQED
jgi:hypothetical protein